MARPPPEEFQHESVGNSLFIDWRRYRETFIYTRRTSPDESIGKAREMGGACTAPGYSDLCGVVVSMRVDMPVTGYRRSFGRNGIQCVRFCVNSHASAGVMR